MTSYFSRAAWILLLVLCQPWSIRAFSGLIFQFYPYHTHRLTIGSVNRAMKDTKVSLTSSSSERIDSGTAEEKSSPIKLKYDLVVIGGGSAGLTAAKFATSFGKTSVIIEEAKLGGDCTWSGCVPSKTLLSCAKAAYTVKKASQYGLELTGSNDAKIKVDMKAIHDKIQRTIQTIYEEEDSAEVLSSKGVDTIQGRASFISNNTLSINLIPTEDLSTTVAADGLAKGKAEILVVAKAGIVICTGATAFVPPVDGLIDSGVDWATYETIFSKLGKLPNNRSPPRLTIIGGGPIGCELAQAFSRFGSNVTLVTPSLLLNDAVEPEAREALQRVFQEQDNIKIVTGRVQKVRQELDGLGKSVGAHCITVSSKNGAPETCIEVRGDLLLVATGRKPNVKKLYDEGGLKEIGVELNDNYNGIKVDDKLCTTVRNIYAAGDCTGDKQFTHYAGYQGAIAARNALLPLSDPGVLSADVPATTFVEPEVASVGLTEAQAIEKYGEKLVRTAIKYGSDRSLCEGYDSKNIVYKVVFHAKTQIILGSTIMSPTAGETISEIGVAMKTKMKYPNIATVMHSYPSHAFGLQVMASEQYYANLAKYKGLLSILKGVGL